MSDGLLPVHGFVLAGGRSSRMGEDKALLPLCGQSLIEIAVAKLRSFCEDVSILGSRDDLRQHAPVVHDLRANIGPGAAFETALAAAKHTWVLLIPVDVPLVPSVMLQRWAVEVLQEDFCGTSFLVVGEDSQPAFSMLHNHCSGSIARALDRGERKLNDLLYAADGEGAGPVCPKNVRCFAHDVTAAQLEFWFANINTPQELAEAEAWAQAEGWQPPTLT